MKKMIKAPFTEPMMFGWTAEEVKELSEYFGGLILAQENKRILEELEEIKKPAPKNREAG